MVSGDGIRAFLPHSKSSGPPKPMSEEQMLKITVGAPPKQINGPVTLVDYDPAWPKLYELEAARIKAALGEKALQIEHVGSTSVPGLIAKPIIDILLVVIDSADEQSYVPLLEAANYTLRIREPNWHEHRLFKGPDTNINLHVFSKGSAETERMLIFRDWLRGNSQDRNRYAKSKQKLAKRNWKYVQNYADAKSEVVESIIARVRGQRNQS